MSAAVRDFKALYKNLERAGLFDKKDDAFKSYMLKDKTDITPVDEAFYDVLNTFGAFFEIFKGTLISEELKSYAEEIRARYDKDFKGIKNLMRPLHLAVDLESYSDDEIKGLYTNRFSNVFNVFKGLVYHPGDEKEEMKKEMMISESIKDKIFEPLKTDETFITIGEELYLKSKRKSTEKSAFENEKDKDMLSAPAIVEIGLNEDVSDKESLENILAENSYGSYFYEMNKACEVLSKEKKNFGLIAEPEPEPEKTEFKYTPVITQKFIDNFSYDASTVVVSTSIITPPKPKIEVENYDIGLYKINDELSAEHFKAYLNGADNFRNSKEIEKFFKNEVELEGIPKTAFDALLDSTIMVLVRKDESDKKMLIRKNTLMGTFGINEKLIEVLEALNILTCSDEGYYLIITPLISEIGEAFGKLWDFSQTDLKRFLA